MNIEICMNPEVIDSVYADEFIQERMSESDYGQFFNSPHVFYLIGTGNGVIVGCMLVLKLSFTEFEIHPVVPAKHKASADRFITSALDWLFENAPIQRITTRITAIYPDVAKFTERMGFSYEGEARAAIYRHGYWLNSWYYALVRGDSYGIRRRRRCKESGTSANGRAEQGD